jgi:hypothetical protein
MMLQLSRLNGEAILFSSRGDGLKIQLSFWPRRALLEIFLFIEKSKQRSNKTAVDQSK